MILKFIKCSGAALLLMTSLSLLSYADADENNGTTLTQPTGSIVGTVPTFTNLGGVPGKVTFAKNSTHAADDELDIGDTLQLSWQLVDREGDADDSLSSVVWTCIHPTEGTRVLASAVSSYTITKGDVGCTISVGVQPTTVTGLPRENEVLNIADISSYDQNDNIIDGPVNPHAINITEYTVAPGTTQSKTVSSNLILKTGWDGAQVQLVTDNPESQVEWKSSNDAIATVTSSGLVTFKEKGAVTFTGTNDAVSASITFDPKLFYVFTSTRGTWYQAEAWCSEHGYTMPTLAQLSAGANQREIPHESLWQEWGNTTAQNPLVGGVLWSSSEWVDADNAYYMYNQDGHWSSNGEGVTEGIVCLEP